MAENSMAPSILGFDYLHVFVTDRQSACQWYEQVMGFEVALDLEFWAADGGQQSPTAPH
jgi:hypothetical protein